MFNVNPQSNTILEKDEIMEVNEDMNSGQEIELNNDHENETKKCTNTGWKALCKYRHIQRSSYPTRYISTDIQSWPIDAKCGN